MGEVALKYRLMPESPAVDTVAVVAALPATLKLSFTVIGTPASGPRLSPAAIAVSALLAAARAPSASIQMIALSAGL